MYNIYLKSNRDGNSIFEASSAERSLFVAVRPGVECGYAADIGSNLRDFGEVEAQFDTFCKCAESAESAAKQALREFDEALAKIDEVLNSNEFKLELYDEVQKSFSGFCDDIFSDDEVTVSDLYSQGLKALNKKIGYMIIGSFDEVFTLHQKKKLRYLALQAASYIYEDAIS